MAEQDILDQLVRDLDLAEWWTTMVGEQPIKMDGFNMEMAAENLPRTEVTASAAIARKFKNFLSYTERTNRWYVWDGKIHVPCEGTLVAFKVAKFYYNAICDALDYIQSIIEKQADDMSKSGAQDAEKNAAKIREIYTKLLFPKHRDFRDRLATEAGLSALVRIMKSDLMVAGDYFDNDQRYFVMRNWVLDLDEFKRNGGNITRETLVKHHPSMPITKIFDADYDPKTNLGHWDGFLKRSIPSETQRSYLQVVTGAAFMGVPKLRCLMALVGPPHSGKSVFVNTMHKLGKEGSGYSAMPDSRAIIKVTGQNFEQDTFRGRRFVGITEPPSGEKVDDDFLKKLTGDEWVETRTLNVKSTGWIPQCVTFIAANTVPKINTRDQAIVDRLQIIEFPIHFRKPVEGFEDEVPVGERLVEGLEDMIMEDRSRILTWIILGMRRFVQEGMKLFPPDEVKRKASQNVAESSTALRFIEEFVEEGLFEIDVDEEPEFMVGEQEAYARYQLWAHSVGERRALTKKFFLQDIDGQYNINKVSVRHNGVKRLFGIRPTLKYRTQFAIQTQSAGEDG